MNARHDPALRELQLRAPDARPRIGVVLGSGWGGLARYVTDAVHVPYAELEGFPRAAVTGHAGALIIGRLPQRSPGAFTYWLKT